jgi:hypothetical protein
MADITVTFGGREVVRYADVPDGSCACSMDWKMLLLRDDVEVIPKAAAEGADSE